MIEKSIEITILTTYKGKINKETDTMMFEGKQSLLRDRQNKVQELCIPFKITFNASPSAKVLATDEPSILFLNTQSLNQVTVASGALDVADGTPSYTSPSDSAGQFGALVKVQEQIEKVECAYMLRRNGTEIIACSMAAVNGITAAGDKIALNLDSSVDLSAASLDACLVVKYVVKK